MKFNNEVNKTLQSTAQSSNQTIHCHGQTAKIHNRYNVRSYKSLVNPPTKFNVTNLTSMGIDELYGEWVSYETLTEIFKLQGFLLLSIVPEAKCGLLLMRFHSSDMKWTKGHIRQSYCILYYKLAII